MFGLILSLLISIATGFLLTCVLWPWPKGVKGSLALRLSLSVGLGFGISSCVFFLCMILFGPSVTAFLSAELALLVYLAVVLGYLFMTSKGSTAPAGHTSAPAGSKVTWIALGALLVLLVMGIVSFAILASLKPHGDWDAWVSWNLRARFLFRGETLWQRAFSPLVPRACPAYPVFLSGLVARCWHYAGRDTVAGPILAAVLFTFGIVGLTFAALHLLRGRTNALLAAAVLLGTPFLLLHGVSQYADVPVAFFFLATVVLLVLSNRLDDARYGLLALAGLMCGLAAYTKHEGLLFLLGLLVIAVVALIRSADRKSHLKRIGVFVAGLALPLGLLVYFKTVMAPSGDYMTAGLAGGEVLRRLGDLSRYGHIARAFVSQLFEVRRWCVLPVVLPFYLLLTGTQVDERDRAGLSTIVWLLAFMLFGHFVMFLITHDNLEWHVKWSLDRLLLQLWPTVVFTFFLVVRPPEEAVLEDSDAHG